MSTTTNYGFPKPAGTDSPNGPVQIGALADGVDTALAGGAGHRSYGKSIISAEQTTTSSSFTELGTPDRVSSVVLPTDGLIFVHYRALARFASGSATTNSGAAAIFLGTTQVKQLTNGAAPAAQLATVGDVEYQWLFTSSGGLAFNLGSGTASDGVTTGLLGADVCAIEAAAGTYDISVRYLASNVAVYAKERHLRVWSQSFG